MLRQPRVIVIGNGSLTTNTALPAITGVKSKDSLEKLAKVVRELYVYYRAIHTGEDDWGDKVHTFFDGGKDCWGKTHVPVWPRIATHIRDLNADPMEYMHAQFGSLNGDKAFLLPNALHTEAATARYHRVRENAATYLKSEVDFQFRSLRAEAVTYEFVGYTPVDGAKKAVANQCSVQASPLVRYCYAAELNLEDEQRKWRARALQQYWRRANDYDAVLKDRIPSEFRQSGRAIVARMLGEYLG